VLLNTKEQSVADYLLSQLKFSRDDVKFNLTSYRLLNDLKKELTELNKIQGVEMDEISN
jgi:hypothetical protein